MRVNKKSFAFIASVLALGAVVLRGQSTNLSYRPLRLRHGKPFPALQAGLLKMREKSGKEAARKMREHAWDLFQGLTDGGPIWETWYTKCDVHLDKCNSATGAQQSGARKMLRSFEVPMQSIQTLIDLQLDGPQQTSGALKSKSFSDILRGLAIDFRAHPQFASVLFNQEAAGHILGNCLYPRTADANGETAKNCPPLPTAPGGIAPFDRGAVVLKIVWGRMIVDKNLVGHLWAWDPQVWNQIQKPNDDIYGFYKPSVKIAVDSKMACENRDYQDDENVPISCFEAFRLEQPDIDALRAYPRNLAIIENSAVVPGNYLVLVGVHITTKEIPDWVWATFWWSNHGVSDSRAAGRPKRIDPKWSHFLMDTTLSGMTPFEKDGGPKICFNPFLETAITNGAVSNCMQCHGKAAFNPKSKIDAYDFGILGRDGRTLASGNDGVHTDLIWSIANGQNPRSRALALLFEQQLQELQLEELRLAKPEAVAKPNPNH